MMAQTENKVQPICQTSSFQQVKSETILFIGMLLVEEFPPPNMQILLGTHNQADALSNIACKSLLYIMGKA